MRLPPVLPASLHDHSRVRVSGFQLKSESATFMLPGALKSNRLPPGLPLVLR